MIEALDRLRAQGKNLKVGLFLDTTIMNNEDLTTQRGKEIFYASIRDFYARIPPQHWAAIDGKPVVWLYDTQKVAAFNQSTFDYVYDQFPRAAGRGGRERALPEERPGECRDDHRHRRRAHQEQEPVADAAPADRLIRDAAQKHERRELDDRLPLALDQMDDHRDRQSGKADEKRGSEE